MTYRLSGKADADLEQLYAWGIDRFGVTQADDYFDTLLTRFDEIAQTPKLWPSVEHIRTGYRRSVCGAHAIYYKIDDDGVLIVRILGRQDITISLPEA